MSHSPARDYAAANLAGCAQECLQWRHKGAFQGPHLREVARLLLQEHPEDDDGDRLMTAERMVIKLALEAAATQVPTPVPHCGQQEADAPPAPRG